MKSTNPLTVFATYRVQPGKENAFLELVRRHYPILRKLGLATEAEPEVWLGEEKEGQPIIFEVFTWASKESPGAAHEAPEVQFIWDAMGKLVEERDGKPMFDFPHVSRVEVAFVETS